MRMIRLALQLPLAEHKGSVRTERRDREIEKFELAHCFRARVFLFVTIAHRLPSAGNRVARNKKVSLERA